MSDPRFADSALEHLAPAEAIALEDNLWWVSGRKKIIETFLIRIAAQISISRLVDVGCGSGGNLEVLARFGEVVGVEKSKHLAEAARRREKAARVICGDLPGEMKSSADVVTLFDVLEHIEDESGFLAQVRSIGKPGHRLLLSVPACPWLYSRHDQLLQHYRRYSHRRLCSVLEASGYEVLDCRFFMFFLFGAALLARGWQMVKARMGFPADRVDLGNCGRVGSLILGRVLHLEARVGFAARAPFGLWLFALCREKQNAILDVSHYE